jgi:nitronate monooxygenase
MGRHRLAVNDRIRWLSAVGKRQSGAQDAPLCGNGMSGEGKEAQMNARRELLDRLGVRHPIIQAPMAMSDTPELVAAVSNAGGLGVLGAAYITPDQIAEVVKKIRARTDKPFGINLFAGGRVGSTDIDSAPALAIIARYHEELGLPAPAPPQPALDPFAGQLEAVLAAEVPIFSFTFGIPNADQMAELKRRGVVVLGTATTVTEARQLEAAGVDAVVAQGSEAGAHRGTFAAPFEAAMIGTMALVPQVVDAVDLPVVASGGIMDGRGIVAAQALGASAVQMGTAFLTCPESAIPAAYKAAIRATQGEETAITRAFSGRPARGVVNEFMRAWQGHEDDILPFPLQNSATRPLRNAASASGDTRFLSLWSGQAGSLARDLPASELVQQLVREIAEVRAQIASEA